MNGMCSLSLRRLYHPSIVVSCRIKTLVYKLRLRENSSKIRPIPTPVSAALLCDKQGRESPH